MYSDNLQTSGLEEVENKKQWLSFIIDTCAPLNGETCASILGLFDGGTKLSGY